MCTAITYKNYFGRNLDLEYHYHESVTITPRNYTWQFRYKTAPKKQYAMIGVATVVDDYPLYYDATNEAGLSMAGLNFPDNAVYQDIALRSDNICSFELIPWILCQCKTTDEASDLLSQISICNRPFNDQFPTSALHWIIADKERSITVEPMKDGLHIYENAVGVLTNNPPFPYHLQNLCNYLNLTADIPENRFSNQIILTPYSRGLGAMGLPGDLSSSSRFIRAAFVKLNSRSGESENSAVSQFFHILKSVEQQYGCVKVGNEYEKTIYSSCCNIDKGIYYYTTYDNSAITGVDMHAENLDGKKPICYPLIALKEYPIINLKMQQA